MRGPLCIFPLLDLRQLPRRCSVKFMHLLFPIKKNNFMFLKYVFSFFFCFFVVAFQQPLSALTHIRWKKEFSQTGNGALRLEKGLQSSWLQILRPHCLLCDPWSRLLNLSREFHISGLRCLFVFFSFAFLELGFVTHQWHLTVGVILV